MEPAGLTTILLKKKSPPLLVWSPSFGDITKNQLTGPNAELFLLLFIISNKYMSWLLSINRDFVCIS